MDLLGPLVRVGFFTASALIPSASGGEMPSFAALGRAFLASTLIPSASGEMCGMRSSIRKLQI